MLIFIQFKKLDTLILKIDLLVLEYKV